MGRKKGVIFSFILMIVESLSSILFTPFLIRCLGSSEYGIYGLVASITAYLYLLDMGVGNAIVRYIAKYRFNKDKSSEKNLIAVTIIFYSFIAIIVLAIGFILNFFLPQIFGTGLTEEELKIAKSMLTVTVSAAAISLFFSPYAKTMIAYEKFVLSRCIDIAKVIFRVILCIIALNLGGRGVAIVSINFIVTFVAGVVSAVYSFCRLKVIPKFHKLKFGFVKEVGGYTFFVMIQMIATQINAMVDQILIGAFVTASTTILAIYTAASQITQYYQSFGSVVNGILMPGVVNMVEQNATIADLQNEMIKVSRITFMFLGVIFVGYALFGKQFMSLWAGSGYTEGYYVSLLIMFPLMLSLTQSIGSQILWAMNRHKVQAVLKISVAICNVVLTYFLIMWKPLIGAALGTAISLFIGDVVVMNWVYRKDIGISIWQYYKETLKGILLCLIITFIVGFAFSFFNISGWTGLFVGVFVVIVVYFVVMALFGLNKNEKLMLKKIPIINWFLKVKE